MSSRVDLKELIEALAGAVIDAQDRIEQHQIAKLGQYFDEDNRPRTVVMRLPSMQPDAEPGTEDLYRAPLLGLVPANALKIKDVEMRFDVDTKEFVFSWRVDGEAPGGGVTEVFVPERHYPNGFDADLAAGVTLHPGPDSQIVLLVAPAAGEYSLRLEPR